jgi:hypothetical protein
MTADFAVPIKMSERANYERVLRAARAQQAPMPVIGHPTISRL